MTECIFVIALSQGTTFSTKASKKTKGILMQNRCKAIAFTPDMLFKISECHDPRFCAKRDEIFVLLNSQHAHSRDSFRRTFFVMSAIFSKSKAFNAAFFLPITV